MLLGQVESSSAKADKALLRQAIEHQRSADPRRLDHIWQFRCLPSKQYSSLCDPSINNWSDLLRYEWLQMLDPKWLRERIPAKHLSYLLSDSQSDANDQSIPDGQIAAIICCIMTQGVLRTAPIYPTSAQLHWVEGVLPGHLFPFMERENAGSAVHQERTSVFAVLTYLRGQVILQDIVPGALELGCLPMDNVQVHNKTGPDHWPGGAIVASEALNLFGFTRALIRDERKSRTFISPLPLAEINPVAAEEVLQNVLQHEQYSIQEVSPETQASKEQTTFPTALKMVVQAHPIQFCSLPIKTKFGDIINAPCHIFLPAVSANEAAAFCHEQIINGQLELAISAALKPIKAGSQFEQTPL